MSRIPNIERKPRTVSDMVNHYGYCAFKEIELGGPSGLEHKVQPADSPYYRKLPARVLIPFTNVTHREIDERRSSSGPRGNVIQWLEFNKSAKECVMEMTDSYADWGFKFVEPLTGYSTEDAAKIFDVIQPFDYKLVELVDQLNFEAPQRIEATEPFGVSYKGETAVIDPLPADLKEVAYEVLNVLQASVDKAFTLAKQTEQKTLISMTKAFSGGDGKTVPDPHDKYVYDQLGSKAPQLLTTEEKKSDSSDAIKVLAEALAGKDSEASERIKAKEAELDEKLAKLDAFLVSQENKDKMAAVRAAKPNKQAA
jgi:hypothetical protein